MRTDLRLPSEEIERLLARYAETREVGLRDRAVEGQLYIAEIVARKFSGRGVEYDDLFQVAALALTRAVERYDPERGARFATFATAAMVGEVKNYFRDKSRLIRAPRRSAERLRLVNAALEALTQELSRAPRADEIAQRTGMAEDEVLEALELKSLAPLSLDAEPAEGERGVADALGEEDAGFLRVESASDLRRAMEALTPRQREVIDLRFFGGLSQREVARRTGASQMSVSRAERAALELLRRALAPEAE